MSKELNYMMKLRQLLSYGTEDLSVDQNGNAMLVRDRTGRIYFQETIEGNALFLPISLTQSDNIFNKIDISKYYREQTEATNKEKAFEAEPYLCDNHEALFLNFEIFGRRCLGGGSESSRNKFSAHHDDFQSDGGKTTVENISPMLNLEHSAIHILAAKSLRDKREIYVYLKDLKEKRKKIESLSEYKKATDLEIMQFHEWLEEKMESQGYVPSETKNNLMIYKRMESKTKSLRKQ